MFKLYKKENSIFPFVEYQFLRDIIESLTIHSWTPKLTALEFGPGISTLALLEGGISKVYTCEHDDKWLQTSKELIRHAITGYEKPATVKLFSYKNVPKISIPEIDDLEFDFAFVDSPVGQGKRWVQHPGQEGFSRLNTLAYAVKRAKIVILHDSKRDGEQKSLEWLEDLNYKIEHYDSPKGFALITRQE